MSAKKTYIQQTQINYYLGAFKEKRLKIAAIQSVGALMELGNQAVNNLVQCACNPQAPKELSLTAIRSLQAVQFTDQHVSKLRDTFQCNSKK